MRQRKNVEIEGKDYRDCLTAKNCLLMNEFGLTVAVVLVIVQIGKQERTVLYL